MGLFNTFHFIFTHPGNRHSRVAAFFRWLRWQIGSRLLPGPAIVPFVDETQLVVAPGLVGATGNIYCGLHEFEDMALVLHLLRADRIFVDVGANVGSYTVLAAGAAGAQCISIEPVPRTFDWLKKNIAINGLRERVRALNVAVGRKNGSLRFTTDLDSTNHVVSDSENISAAIEVPVQTLDSVLEDTRPSIIKIDVEGFETEVVSGASRSLAESSLLALILELNGSGARYGFDEDALHRSLLKSGFETCRYHPFDRKLTQLHGEKSTTGNTLYIRDIERARSLIASAPSFRLGTGVQI